MPFYHNAASGRRWWTTRAWSRRSAARRRCSRLDAELRLFTNVVGFEETTKEALPDARLKLYDESGRNAKVLVKTAGVKGARPLAGARQARCRMLPIRMSAPFRLSF